ncbi:MAG: hypothetical protein WEE51_07000 [Pirellulaceae bacterium]
MNPVALATGKGYVGPLGLGESGVNPHRLIQTHYADRTHLT